MRNSNIDEIVAKAIEMKEAGKTEAEIYDLFPAAKTEIAEALDTIALIGSEKEKIIAPKQTLNMILDHVRASDGADAVTEGGQLRLTSRGVAKGRASNNNNYFNKIIHYMSNAWKTIVPIGVVALILVVFGVYQFGGKSADVNAPAGQTEQKGQALKTGSTEIAADIDSDINSIIDGLAGEEALLGEEETDLALVSSDSQALIAFDNLNEEYGQ